MIKMVPELVGPDFSNDGKGVYFLRIVGVPLVKIGFASNWQTRCSELQCGCPFQQSVMLVGKGNRLTERKCQGALAGNGFRSAWFFLTERVRAFIDDAIGQEGALDSVADDWMSKRKAALVARCDAGWDRAKQILPDIFFEIATVLPLSSAGRAA